MGWDWEEWVIGLIGFVLLLIIILIAVGTVQQSRSPTFELYKNQWVCTESHTQVVTSMILVGKVMVPQTHVQTICDVYTRTNKGV